MYITEAELHIRSMQNIVSDRYIQIELLTHIHREAIVA